MCAAFSSQTAITALNRSRHRRPTAPGIEGLRSDAEAYGRLVAPAVFNTDVVE